MFIYRSTQILPASLDWTPEALCSQMCSALQRRSVFQDSPLPATVRYVLDVEKIPEADAPRHRGVVNLPVLVYVGAPFLGYLGFRA